MTGEKRQPAGYAFTTADYDIFQVIYVLRGRLYFQHDQSERVLRPGCAVVLGPGSAFRLSCRKQGYEGICYLESAVAGAQASGLAAAVQADAALRQLAALLAHEIAVPATAGQKPRESLGEALAWQAVRLAGKTAPPPGDPDQYARYWSGLACDALAAALYARRDPAEILAGLPLGYRQLARYLRRTTGLSPKQYQAHLREEEARRLLRETALCVTSIACELGFSSSQHFALWFRTRTKQTPIEYRRNELRAFIPMFLSYP